MAEVVRLTRKAAEWERAAPRKIPKARWRQLEQHAAEVLRLYASRFSMQERLGRQVINALDGILAAHGVAVYLDAAHLCMQMHGVREQEATTRTTFWRGAYEADEQLRNEFLKLCQTGDHYQ